MWSPSQALRGDTEPSPSKLAWVHGRALCSLLPSPQPPPPPPPALPPPLRLQRVYVGNLPAGVTEAELRQAINELMVQCGGCSAAGFPIVSCKLYPVRIEAPAGVGMWQGASRL